MMSNRFVAAVEAAALETAVVLPRCALGNINPNFDEGDSVFNDESEDEEDDTEGEEGEEYKYCCSSVDGNGKYENEAEDQCDKGP